MVVAGSVKLFDVKKRRKRKEAQEKICCCFCVHGHVAGTDIVPAGHKAIRPQGNQATRQSGYKAEWN